MKDATKQYRYPYDLVKTGVITLVIIVTGITTLLTYLSGIDYSYIMYGAVIYVSIGILCLLFNKLNSIVADNKLKVYIGLFLCLIPLLMQIVFEIIVFYKEGVQQPNSTRVETQIISTLSYLIYITLAGTYYFFCLPSTSTELVMIFDNVKTTTPKHNKFLDDISTLGIKELYKDSYFALTAVIQKLRNRADDYDKMKFTTLIIMVIILFIGGAASIGTMVFDEVKNLREIEKHRILLIKTIEELELYSESYEPNISELTTLVNQRYGDGDTYKSLIESIERQSLTSWPDIAMRVTIAALTLFLVQIFFHIYKYNQQQSSMLYNRAELLELHCEPNADINELRKSLLNKEDYLPKFDNGPESPTGKVIDVISKAQNTGK